MHKFKYLLGIIIISIIGVVVLNRLGLNSHSREPGAKLEEETQNKVVEGCLTNDEINSINSEIGPINQAILAAAKERTTHDVSYVDKYYSSNQGKPPDHEGVCTDLFWRAMEGAEIDFQQVLYDDMKANTRKYPLYIWNMSSPNKSIDFRRVPNIESYLKLHAQSLPIEVNECDLENLSQWKAGDIVIFSLDGTGPSDHIAIVSENRDENGIPNLIHNYGRGEIEDPGAGWLLKAVGHYRWR